MSSNAYNALTCVIRRSVPDKNQRVAFRHSAVDLCACADLFLLAGGTNLRVCLVTLEGEGKFEITQAKYRLSEEQKQDDGQKLFDFCGECLKAFVDTHKGEGHIKPGEVLPLGFTVGRYMLSMIEYTDASSQFSYPCACVHATK